MWTVILLGVVAVRVLLTKGLNATWLLALEGTGGGPVRWRDNVATRDPDSGPGWRVIYPSVLASDNFPLIRNRERERAEWRDRRSPPFETLASWTPRKWTFQTLHTAHELYVHMEKHTHLHTFTSEHTVYTVKCTYSLFLPFLSHTGWLTLTYTSTHAHTPEPR